MVHAVDGGVDMTNSWRLVILVGAVLLMVTVMSVANFAGMVHAVDDGVDMDDSWWFLSSVAGRHGDECCKFCLAGHGRGLIAYGRPTVRRLYPVVTYCDRCFGLQ